MREGMMAKPRPHGFSVTLASLVLVVTSTVAGAVAGAGRALAGPVRCGDTITADSALCSHLVTAPK